MISGPRRGNLSDDDVRDVYAWPESGRWVRATMVTTLDGAAAGPDGLSGSISAEVDKAVFNAIRRLADVVLVGAGTLRAERYGPMRAKPADAEQRAADGQAPAPVLAIVSGSLDLDWDDAVFSESSERPIIFAGSEAEPARIAAARHRCDVVVSDTARVDVGEILDVLDQRGLRRIICEGGPTLLESLVAADLLDEADITISPLFAGTSQTPRTTGLSNTVGFELQHVLSTESFLMTRYVRRGRPA